MVRDIDGTPHPFGAVPRRSGATQTRDPGLAPARCRGFGGYDGISSRGIRCSVGDLVRSGGEHRPAPAQDPIGTGVVACPGRGGHAS